MSKLSSDRQAIAKPYGLDEKVLISLTHHLTYVRNICAHHGRQQRVAQQVTGTDLAVPTEGYLIRSEAKANLCIFPSHRQAYQQTEGMQALKRLEPLTRW
ncbi:hypothetical protein ASC97_24025 [Rhizobium sp. Root1203]|jgi:hypothetical protein|uniref:Abi family protein n=1 Tax=Rhizobium sp. Root1203 TaxID=1736427 RepID=UPI00071458D7|nr:Abi family protein [Rhizobium sp. Root1203]KQV28882.1 hypothetical protein ASC97_24025 [Rhizobium sp. Root1203]